MDTSDPFPAHKIETKIVSESRLPRATLQISEESDFQDDTSHPLSNIFEVPLNPYFPKSCPAIKIKVEAVAGTNSDRNALTPFKFNVLLTVGDIVLKELMLTTHSVYDFDFDSMIKADFAVHNVAAAIVSATQPFSRITFV